ncbi:protein SPA1-RELATED 4 [Andrographis paniculata]|uniref:protein SPA1-RELATED 4 n=1 Tax=Andrographis paniculata TaxID=175694 RepID=UPI0021E7898B|nr:protein SPA1-RELATED 4 [Andrographis paniculata]
MADDEANSRRDDDDNDNDTDNDYCYYSCYDSGLNSSSSSLTKTPICGGDDVSLRQWLDNPDRAVVFSECLHIFSQIVDIVSLAHSLGIVVQNVRPSCFIMSSFNRVSFIESASCSDSTGSDSPDPSDAAGIHFPIDDDDNDGEDHLQQHLFPMKQILVMESNWYRSPEEASGTPTWASDIYQLGVLLFELFCTFGFAEEKTATMASLKHRVLPPQLLLKWPKVASFCLTLLHPDPSSRPKMSELQQSEFLNEPRNEIEEREAATELREKIEEHELLLEFLLLLQKQKQDCADLLEEKLLYISSDIEEVTKMQTNLRLQGSASSPGLDKMSIADDESSSSGSRKRIKQGIEENPGRILSKSSRLMKNFRRMESVYFLTRQRAAKQVERSLIRNPLSKEACDEQRQSGWISTFLDGLRKYLSFSKLSVKADLKQCDVLNSSNLVCSLSFDRDGEFFAMAGVNKKIKVFEYNSILSEDCDIHYPVVEMASRSKLSSICWNSYIKSQIASSNIDGIVQVWDVTRNQTVVEMREHERRVWSVDFSVADPTMLASGSDDGSVKLWNTNQGASVGAIKTKANVCCVQFPADSGRAIAFGSADSKIYYYDLRNSKAPLCTLVGHNKTVSYVKFVDSRTLVSASTDNTLKLWDLSMCTSRVVDSPLQSFTGHLNVKNFVGLSVSEGYIATGSETNEVYVYHKAFPMPALSFKFSSTDPFSGQVDDTAAQFISSICWRGQTSTLVAANSMGNVKLLEMV